MYPTARQREDCSHANSPQAHFARGSADTPRPRIYGGVELPESSTVHHRHQTVDQNSDLDVCPSIIIGTFLGWWWVVWWWFDPASTQQHNENRTSDLRGTYLTYKTPSLQSVSYCTA
jgi:hypothetical protein